MHLNEFLYWYDGYSEAVERHVGLYTFAVHSIFKHVSTIISNLMSAL